MNREVTVIVNQEGLLILEDMTRVNLEVMDPEFIVPVKAGVEQEVQLRTGIIRIAEVTIIMEKGQTIRLIILMPVVLMPAVNHILVVMMSMMHQESL